MTNSHVTGHQRASTEKLCQPKILNYQRLHEENEWLEEPYPDHDRELTNIMYFTLEGCLTC